MLTRRKEVPRLTKIAEQDFPEEDYLRLFPDVGIAIETGLFKNGYEHFVSTGRAELESGHRSGFPAFPGNHAVAHDNADLKAREIGGKRPKMLPPAPSDQPRAVDEGADGAVSGFTAISFPEEDYLLMFPDVAAAVKSGSFTSGFEHYMNAGRSELESGLRSGFGGPGAATGIERPVEASRAKGAPSHPRRKLTPSPAPGAKERSAGIGLPKCTDAKAPEPVALDTAFYKAYYADLNSMTDEQAAEHWNALGIQENRFPSPRTLINARLGSIGLSPNAFSVAAYKFLNPDLMRAFSQDWEFVVHFIDFGRTEGRNYEIPEDEFLQSLYPSDSGGVAAALRRGTHVYRDLDDMLAKNGVRSINFISVFSPEDYVTLTGECSLVNKFQCLRHFLEIGRKRLRPISIENWFDPAFYAIQCPQAPVQPGAMYLHWINEGFATGLKPNAQQFMKTLGLRNTACFTKGFEWASFVCLNPDLQIGIKQKWEALKYLIQFGVVENRPGLPGPQDAPDVYLAAADKFAEQNRLQDAKHLYENVISVAPTNGFAAQHYADCLYRLGEYCSAIIRYQYVIQIGKANVWTHINLADCFQRTFRYAEATSALRVLRDAYPGDVAIARRTLDAAKLDYDRTADTATQIARSGLLADAQRLLARAGESLSAALANGPRGANRLHGPVRSVLIVANMDLAQCRFYRVEQKQQQLKQAGIATTVINIHDSLETVPSLLFKVDVAIFYRVAATPALMNLIHTVRAAGIPTIYDIDDLIFDPAHYPDPFESYGGQITKDEYAGLVTGTGLFRTAMSACDYGLAPTQALATMMQPIMISGKAFVHRNGLSQAHLDWCGRVEGQESDEIVRIFYGSGTKAHNTDFDMLVAPAFRKLLDATSMNIQIVLMGHLTLPSILKPYAAKIIQLPPAWDISVYWATLRRMHINIAVLMRSEATDCKSEIKWLEAGMFGIPSVVSKTATYEEVIEDGVDGVMVDTAEAWHAALAALIEDRGTRERIGAAAAVKIARDYGIEAASQNLMSIFSAISDTSKSQERIRVLIVNVFFPPQAIGGATRVVADNVIELQRLHGNQLDIRVFTTTEGGDRPYSLRTYEWNGIKVTGVTAGSYAEVDLNPDDQQMYTVFGDYLDMFAPHIVHFHCIQRLTGAACQAARDRRIPYYITLHDGWWISDRQFLLDDYLRKRSYYDWTTPDIIKNFGSKGLHRMSVLADHLRAAEAILPVSHSFAKLYQACGFTNIVPVPNGVSQFEPYPRQASASGRVRIAHIGGMSAHKGYNLLKAVLMRADFGNMELLVIDHSLPPGVEVADMWGATPVRFRPKVPQPDVGRLYAEIDILAAPSLWSESYGLVVREAILSGCWVIVSDRGALSEDIDPSNGFVIDVGSMKALEQVLRKIDANHKRYLVSPKGENKLRRSIDQANDLARMYLALAPADVRKSA